ncbi:hypothetical protein FB45DRAFT_1037510 [Roridomyces roridus]|uniref:Uncharacterized protein n=1 Tax=Roridomyces roridus TaxID=1738132 RepID=A0AAD7B5A7_9AGAR|nr:hypothetical protein FB45DRAFT_1037510 [Roridomyces roridus]
MPTRNPNDPLAPVDNDEQFPSLPAHNITAADMDNVKLMSTDFSFEEDKPEYWGHCGNCSVTACPPGLWGAACPRCLVKAEAGCTATSKPAFIRRIRTLRDQIIAQGDLEYLEQFYHDTKMAFLLFDFFRGTAENLVMNGYTAQIEATVDVHQLTFLRLIAYFYDASRVFFRMLDKRMQAIMNIAMYSTRYVEGGM